MQEINVQEWDVWAADVVRRIRLLPLTQQAFAEKCGLCGAYVSAVLRGKRKITRARNTIDETLTRLESEHGKAETA